MGVVLYTVGIGHPDGAEPTPEVMDGVAAEIQRLVSKGGYHATVKLGVPVEPETVEEYTTRPTVIRIHTDGKEFFVDGADDESRYTESCWSYDTLDDAIANIKDFVEKADVVWPWDTPDHSDKLEGLSAKELLELAEAAKVAARNLIVEEGKRQVAADEAREGLTPEAG